MQTTTDGPRGALHLGKDGDNQQLRGPFLGNNVRYLPILKLPSHIVMTGLVVWQKNTCNILFYIYLHELSCIGLTLAEDY
jgi:hypothetical protein